MSTSNPLGLPLITDAQNAKHVTHNDAVLKLSQALGNMSNIDVTSGNFSITTDVAQRNKFFLVENANTAGREITFPLLNRAYVVRSSSSNAENFTVDIDGGTSPITFTPGGTSLVFTREDGFIGAFFLATSSSVSNFLDLGDAPVSYSGATGFLVRVNTAGNGLDFLDPATLAPITTVDALDDVDLTNIADGEILVWNNANGQFEPAALPSGGTSTLDGLNDVNTGTPSDGDLLTWNGTASEWQATQPASSAAWNGVVDVETKTADYTLTLGDQGSVIFMEDSGALTLTVPTNATQAFPVGAQISVVRNGAGAVTIAGDTGVTVNAPETLALRKQYSAATLTKIATNTWHVIGDFEEAV